MTPEIIEPAPKPQANGQSKYEVRFEWGIDGARAILPGAGVVVVVDALPARVRSQSPQDGVLTPLEAALSGIGVPVLRASFRNRSAVARWVLDHQERLGTRAMVAVVAAGENRPAGGVDFAVEDLLAAGAVIDALAELGIDFSSPEAAAAAAAFSGLARATGHLLTASATGQTLIAAGLRDQVVDAAGRDTSEVVEVF